MKDLNIQPDVHIYNKVLYASSDNPVAIATFLQEMQVTVYKYNADFILGS
jgi:hypothetical protein